MACDQRRVDSSFPSDDKLDQPVVAVLSDEFWRTKLGADPATVGKTLSIDGIPTTIIGITPADFRVPIGSQILRADVWMPIRFQPNQLTQRRSNFLQLVGRLADGATPESAQSELRGLFAGIIASFPILRGEDVRVGALQSESVQTIRTPLLLLFGAVCMVLLIAATNVAALLLARGVQRQREMAVRTALGATRWAAMRPPLAESLLITVIGASLGLALAVAGVRTIGALAAARMPQLAGLTLDTRVIAFAVTLALIVGIACGLVPAWRGSAVDPQDALRAGRGAGAGKAHNRALRLLVVFEIGLSLMLLIGAGLTLKGFAGLLNNDPGFETAHVLTLRVTTSSARYPNQTTIQNFLEPTLEAIRALPNVESVGAINLPPYVNWGSNSNVRYEGRPFDDPTRLPLVEYRSVTPGFFAVTKQRLISGRLIERGDDERPSAPVAVVVNQALVDRDFKGLNPVGSRFHLSDTTFGTIVGVVSNIRNVGPVASPAAEMYWSYRQNGLGSSGFPLMVRVKGDPTSVVTGIRAAVRRIDASAAIARVMPMSDVISSSLGNPRFYFSLLGTFAAVATSSCGRGSVRRAELRRRAAHARAGNSLGARESDVKPSRPRHARRTSARGRWTRPRIDRRRRRDAPHDVHAVRRESARRPHLDIGRGAHVGGGIARDAHPGATGHSSRSDSSRFAPSSTDLAYSADGFVSHRPFVPIASGAGRGRPRPRPDRRHRDRLLRIGECTLRGGNARTDRHHVGQRDPHDDRAARRIAAHRLARRRVAE